MTNNRDRRRERESSREVDREEESVRANVYNSYERDKEEGLLLHEKQCDDDAERPLINGYEIFL